VCAKNILPPQAAKDFRHNPYLTAKTYRKNMEIRIDGKIAVVTGGGSGIGASICREFARAGAYVFVLDLNATAAEEIAKEIRQAGGQATGLKVDLTIQAEVVDLFNHIAREKGRIDILVNNAGIAQVGTLDQTSEADFDRIFQVNVKGVYNGMYAAISHMQAQGAGAILNMGSIASMVGLPDRFGYSMSKGAVMAMTYTVARDYLKYNIRCNSLAPARVHTPFVDGFIAKNYPGREAEMFEKLSRSQPVGRMGKPEEVAQLALFLCSDAAGFITGTNVPIDGGFINLNT
jgi:2-keto-3-deoxy-L-fuconate dehydrogenase